jgi:uncharacterized protein YciI
MPTFVARSNHSSRFRDAGSQVLKGEGRWPEDLAPIVDAHVAYVKDLGAKGKMICGGPVVAFTWGLSVLRADSLEEAKKLIEDDPAKKSGLWVDYEIEPWFHVV